LLKLKEENEKLAQYTRINCLILYGIKEEHEENTNLLAKNFFVNKLNITISQLVKHKSGYIPVIKLSHPKDYNASKS